MSNSAELQQPKMAKQSSRNVTLNLTKSSIKKSSNLAIETDDEGRMSPRTKGMTEAIKEVSVRSPRIHLTYNRSSYNPVGSLSPETLKKLNNTTRRVNRLGSQVLPGILPTQIQARQ